MSLVEDHLRAIPLNDVMSCVRDVAQHDRYQASLGIQSAAAAVAERACRMGLKNTEILQFPADGVSKWWSFRAPRAWTPVRAQLVIRSHGKPLLTIDHSQRPFALATYSAPTPTEGITAPLANFRNGSGATMAGRIAVVSARDAVLDTNELARTGALGFLTDVTCKEGNGQQYSGRVELHSDTPLFGFSLTSVEIANVQRSLQNGATASVNIALDTSGTMPVVTSVIPGDKDQEVWLTAHLCHPRPGANDNASGVAALLGAASSLLNCGEAQGSKSRRPVRFIWGPEFLGVTAILHERLAGRQGARLPALCLNLDMVGDDQSTYGTPFVVERSPNIVPSLLNPLAEHVVEEVFLATKEHPGAWRPQPFSGFSDHALFADRNIARPAVQFCHYSDPLNHSAGDSTERISAIEMLRAAAAAAALARFFSDDSLLQAQTTKMIVQQWCDNELVTARSIAASVGATRKKSGWKKRFIRHIQQHNKLILAATHTGSAQHHEPAAADPKALESKWEGPFNVRAMLDDLPFDLREGTTQALSNNRKKHALLVNLAMQIDGTRNRENVVREASYSARTPLNCEEAHGLLDVLIRANWVAERRD